ncbi:CDP-glycerol glycerophosphotransferase [Paenibacillus antibioticophila]|uniref:CDP-glycerol glycerophosphotransferase n=1 Tax=Paenibacillus antibioticophila TaxID=1274374 RepID=A0A919XNR9_9BACL|nr:glycosyltransferase [Paenibacillus antibioticophila]GIO35159.1 CDP-glycerol glycerophosphotransferase [Paenibacillus antibioticophila]
MNINRLKQIIKKLIYPFIELLVKPDERKQIFYTNYFKRGKINNNLIVYEAFHGANISCNPYALYLELLNHKEYSHLQHIWILDGDQSEVNHKIKKGTLIVRRNSLKYLKTLATAKYLVNNNTFPPYFQKKQNQIYVNTWHGTPLKTLGRDVETAKVSEHSNVQRNLLHTDFFIAPNLYTAKKMISAYDVEGIFNGEILDLGYPRIDLTFKSDYNQVKRELGVAADEKIIVYFPTWRGGIHSHRDTSHEIYNNYKQMSSSLPEGYVLLLKVHHITQKYFVKNGLGSICVPPEFDPNVLLAVTDLLITDYSSVFFDYLHLQRPIIFLADDWDEYRKERGFYLEKSDLPGPLCSEINEVNYWFMHLDELQYNYQDKLKECAGRYSYHDDGKATERLVKVLFGNHAEKQSVLNSYRITEKNNKTKILLYSGGLNNNGITVALVNLLNKIDYNRFDLTLIDYNLNNPTSIGNAEKINPKVKKIYRIGDWNRGIIEYYLHHLILGFGLRSPILKKIVPKSLYIRELSRLLGNSKFDISIDFGGYSGFWSLLFAYSDVKRKCIYQHNDMWQEYHKIINGSYKHRKNLGLIFTLYNQFDSIVSVAESTRDENLLRLGKYIDEPNKMVFAHNIIDFEKVLKMKDDATYFNHNSNDYLVTNIKDDRNKLVIESVVAPSLNCTNFINVGRLSPEKGHENLIKAFYELSKEYKDTRLYIVGEGPLDKELRKLIKQLDLEESVVLTGHASNPYSLINKCDCFVLSSNYEGQGLVLLEAQILNKAIISTNVTGARSVISGKNGFLVENSIEGLLQGMQTYLREGITPSSYNYEEYNAQALRMFYHHVCGWEVEPENH